MQGFGLVNAAFPAISPDGEGIDTHANPAQSRQSNPPAPTPVPGSVSLDLQNLGNVHEADNVRWSLAQGTSAREQYYSPENGVDWKALRSAELSGTIPIKAKHNWSFNDTFGYLEGYKYASGVYAGGHCALATVLRGAAYRAGLSTWYKLHWWAIPGFSYYESVSIWWGRDDLVLYNSTSQDLVLAWSLTPRKRSPRGRGL